MFSHIQLGAKDLTSMTAFYDAVLATLGLERIEEPHDGGPTGAGWHDKAVAWRRFYIQLPINGLPATWGNGTQVSFLASSSEAVDQAWATVLALGGIDEGAPGLRPHYGEDYYGAYCRDPEGNKLCFVCYTAHPEITAQG